VILEGVCPADVAHHREGALLAFDLTSFPAEERQATACQGHLRASWLTLWRQISEISLIDQPRPKTRNRIGWPSILLPLSVTREHISHITWRYRCRERKCVCNSA
jgi:hypothetical protein